MDHDQEINQHNQFKDDIVQKEKEKLLQQHLPYIDGFMPKGLLEEKKDEKYLTNTQQFINKRMNKTHTRPW